MPISRSSSHALPEVLVVFVIDGSWRMNKHFRNVCEKILRPIIQKLKSPKVIDLEDKQNKDRITPALRYGLVIFRDFHSINIVESRHFNADLSDFYMQLDSLVFCQGGFDNAIAEGLIAAVEMFDTHKQQMHYELIEPEKHCILVTNSNPLMDAVHHNEDERYDEYALTDICEEMARQNIHLSLVVPDRELKLVKLDEIVKTVNKEKEVVDLSQEFDVGMLSDQANVDAPQTKKIKTEKVASTDNQNINKSTPSPSQPLLVQRTQGQNSTGKQQSQPQPRSQQSMKTQPNATPPQRSPTQVQQSPAQRSPVANPSPASLPSSAAAKLPAANTPAKVATTPRLGTQQIQRDANANIISVVNTSLPNATSPGPQIVRRAGGTPGPTATPGPNPHLAVRPSTHRLWNPEVVAQLTIRNQFIHANNAGISTSTGITTSPQVANTINIANGLVGLQSTSNSHNTATPTQGSVQRTLQTPSTVSANITSQLNVQPQQTNTTQTLQRSA
ncbi:694_t:CDS:2, partial [Paraglomus occultum]